MEKFSTILTTLAAAAAVATTGAGVTASGHSQTEGPEAVHGAEGRGAAHGTAKSGPDLEGSVDYTSGGIADSCTGTKLGTKQMVNDYGTTVGRVELWYSPINNGRNCVITYNYIDGPSSYTDASIWVDDDGDGEEDRWRYDEGYYYSYAGASYLDNTNGKCIAISATVEGLDMNTDRDDAHHFRDWYHCG